MVKIEYYPMIFYFIYFLVILQVDLLLKYFISCCRSGIFFIAKIMYIYFVILIVKNAKQLRLE